MCCAVRAAVVESGAANHSAPGGKESFVPRRFTASTLRRPVALLWAAMAVLLVSCGEETGTTPAPETGTAPAPVVIDWEVLEEQPDPAVVTDPSARRAITESGHPWRVRHKRSGMELLLVPAGTYLRGSPDSDGEADDDERPQHQVTISKPFYLGRYAVTQAQWRKVMAVESSSRFEGDKRPVENVSWNYAQSFVTKIGLRLPTEAEWEYACRAGITEPRYGDLGAIAWHEGNSEEQTHDVGGKQANPWGFHDMIGNAWEWCEDGYEANAYSRCRGGVTDPVVSVGSSRVVRGGSWRSAARNCRSARRSRYAPTTRSDYFGFRVARAP